MHLLKLFFVYYLHTGYPTKDETVKTISRSFFGLFINIAYICSVSGIYGNRQYKFRTIVSEVSSLVGDLCVKNVTSKK